jgi:hypothetical protein
MSEDRGDTVDKIAGRMGKSLERKIEGIRKKYESRMQAIADRIDSRVGGEQAEASTEDKTVHPNFDQRFQGQLTEKLADPQLAKINVYDVLKVEHVDEVFNRIFRIDEYFEGEGLRYPTYYCETLEEFFEPYMKHMALSQETKAQLIEMMTEQARQNAMFSSGGTFGVNWPGDGCYLNGWLLSYPDTDNPSAALENPEKIPIILEVLAHEKLGHGFLSEFTSLGREMQSIQLARFDLAEKFNIKLTDTPRGILLREKWELLFQHFIYAEEGYATWIERLMLREMAGIDNKAYELADVKQLLEMLDANRSIPRAGNYGLSLAEAYSIVIEPWNGIERIHEAVLMLESLENRLAEPFSRLFGQTPRYVIGSTILQQIENRFGTMMVPYVMSIAYNVSYDLESIANSDLERILIREPSMNIHSRLLSILALDEYAVNSVETLVAACRSTLNMAIPAQLQI